MARLGSDGYELRDALRVTRERAGALGEDVLGFPPLFLMAFVPLALAASMVDGLVLAFVLGLTGAYGLFYYGNTLFFGARHLFPAAPFVWVLVARGALLLPHRASGWLDSRHVRGGAIAVILAVAAIGARSPWATRTHAAAEFQSTRSDLRRSLATQGLDRGRSSKSHDLTSVAAAADLWMDGDRLQFSCWRMGRACSTCAGLTLISPCSFRCREMAWAGSMCLLRPRAFGSNSKRTSGRPLSCREGWGLGKRRRMGPAEARSFSSPTRSLARG